MNSLLDSFSLPKIGKFPGVGWPKSTHTNQFLKFNQENRFNQTKSRKSINLMKVSFPTRSNFVPSLSRKMTDPLSLKHAQIFSFLIYFLSKRWIEIIFHIFFIIICIPKCFCLKKNWKRQWNIKYEKPQKKIEMSKEGKKSRIFKLYNCLKDYLYSCDDHKIFILISSFVWKWNQYQTQ